MISDKDVEKLKGTFATKEDLKAFATKEDLKRFATKDDTDRKFEETNRHFDVVAGDIKSGITFLAEQVSANSEKFVQYDEKMKKIDVIDTDVSLLKNRVSVLETKCKK